MSTSRVEFALRGSLTGEESGLIFTSLQMMLMCKGACQALCLGSHHQGVFTASLEMWLTALVAVRADAFQPKHQHR